MLWNKYSAIIQSFLDKRRLNKRRTTEATENFGNRSSWQPVARVLREITL